MIKTLTPSGIIARWFLLIGVHANNTLELIENNGVYMITDDLDTRSKITSCSDWSVTLAAESLSELEALCSKDLKECGHG